MRNSKNTANHYRLRSTYAQRSDFRIHRSGRVSCVPIVERQSPRYGVAIKAKNQYAMRVVSTSNFIMYAGYFLTTIDKLIRKAYSEHIIFATMMIVHG